MALNLETDLGSGTGLLYITTTSGAAGSSTGIITNLTNDTQGLMAVMNHANTNDKLVDNDSGGDVNQQYRYKYWVYNNAAAVQGTVHASATEITRFVTTFNTIGRSTSPTLTSNVLKYQRTGAITTVILPNLDADVLYLRDELSTDNVDDINQEGDIVILRLATSNTGNVTIKNTHTNVSGYQGYDAISLRVPNKNFVMDSLGDCIAFQKYNKNWREIFRTQSRDAKVSELRAQEIPFQSEDVKSIEATVGGTLEPLVAGVDSGVVNVTGTKTLSSAFNLPLSTAAINGDRFDIWYRADITANTSGGNKVTIAGVDLTDTEALNGSTKPILIQANYLGATDSWKVIKILNSDETERTLGNPTANGQVLVSTTAGVRSWADAPNTVNIASATYNFATHTGAAGTYTIGLDAIPAGAIIELDRAVIEMHTATTAASGTPTIAIGYTGGASDVDAIHDETNFSASPFNSASAVTRVTPAGSGTVIKVSDTAKTSITVTIASNDLSAGRFTVHVPYIA